MFKNNTKNFFILMAIIFTLVIFTGCQGTDKEEGTDSTDTKEEGEPQKGGDLVVATPASPPSMDWGGQGATETKMIAWHIFEELFAYDENYEIKPMLVEDYDVNEEGTKYTLHLREGVNFHDGSTMEAEDVVASLGHWEKTTVIGKETFDHIDQINTLDEYTLEIELKDKYPALFSNFADLNHALFIMPKEKAEEADGKLISQEQLVGTGPYEFKNWDIGEQLTIQRFDDYTSREEDWGGLTGKKVAYHDTIEFNVVSDAQVKMNGVISEKYDFALNIPPDLFETLESNKAVKTEKQELDTFATLLLNHSKETFKNNEDFGHAINYALDKESILTAAYGSPDFFELDGALFNEAQGELYTKEGTDLYDEYDPEKAKKIIEKSDYDGETLTIITTSDYHDYEKIAQVIEQQLGEVGLNVKIESYEWATLFDKWEDPEVWDMTVITWPWYYSPITVPVFAEDEHAGWDDLTEIFELQDDWAASDDPDEQKEIIGKINKEIYDEMIWVQLGNSKGLNISTSTLKGFADWDNVRFWNTWDSDLD